MADAGLKQMSKSKILRLCTTLQASLQRVFRRFVGIIYKSVLPSWGGNGGQPARTISTRSTTWAPFYALSLLGYRPCSDVGRAICMKIGRAPYHIFSRPNISITDPTIPYGFKPQIWHAFILQYVWKMGRWC